MKFSWRAVFLLPSIALVGCSVPSTSIVTTPATTWTNWQFQAGSAITSPPNTYPNFAGGLQIQNNQANGTLSTTNSATSGSQSLQFTSMPAGSTTAAISTATVGWELNFTEPATPYSTFQVGVVGGCVGPPGSSGPVCTAIFAVPSVGVEVAPITGTYAGTLTAALPSTASGSATLTITQSTTPSSDGSFPLTATMVLPTELGTYSGSGSVIGEGISLSYSSQATGAPSITLQASTNPTATQIVVSNLTFTQAGTSYSFSGTLNRQ